LWSLGFGFGFQGFEEFAGKHVGQNSVPKSLVRSAPRPGDHPTRATPAQVGGPGGSCAQAFGRKELIYFYTFTRTEVRSGTKKVMPCYMEGREFESLRARQSLLRLLNSEEKQLV